MSGTLVGVVDTYHTPGSPANGNQEVFVNLYDFMQRNVTVGNAALHASNYGSGGTGFDYHDGANPAGENAWAVFRFLASASSLRTTDFYVLIQWADTDAFGASPGNPGSLSNGTGDSVGFMMAYREDGGDPWNGTTNANGADTKGTPVWAGTGLHVLSELNETGARSTNKEDLTYIYDVGTASSSRVHMCGDADGMWFGNDGQSGSGSNGTLDNIYYLGVYTPRADLAITNPYIITSSFQPYLQASSSYTLSSASGAMSLTESRNAARVGLRCRDYIWSFSHPEDLGAGPEYIEFPIELARSATYDSEEFGLLGHLNTDIIRLTYGPANNSANAAFTRAFIGDTNSTNDHKFSLAWGGGSAPDTAITRDGVVF